MSDGTTVQAAADMPAAAPSRRTEILDGLKITLPFMVGAAPFGVIFGALAISQGLSVFETMALSLFVFSGSAQFVAIALIAAATPAWVIWLVTFILNLRHTLYAATLVGYVRHLSIGWRFILSAGLTDETFAAMEDRYRRLGVHRNSHWAYLASIVAMHVNWNCWTLIGIAVGSQISGLDGLGLEFAAIATFIGMVVQKLRTPGAQTAAAVAGILAALLAALPYKAGLTIATLVAIAVAVMVERRLERRSRA
ncbi:MAG TPA: AzlC family ABC transporter permease [Dongiaceae bacterium]|nr:AzlC family ABC transporter permease [Dongiaceae bacterium]